jgi:hypothetical protein
LIAAYLSADDRYLVHDHKPYARWGGLFRGGTFTAVCVAVVRDNPFGIIVRDNWAFKYDNGQIKPVEKGTESCSDLSPFPDLMKAISARRGGIGRR